MLPSYLHRDTARQRLLSVNKKAFPNIYSIYIFLGVLLCLLSQYILGLWCHDCTPLFVDTYFRSLYLRLFVDGILLLTPDKSTHTVNSVLYYLCSSTTIFFRRCGSRFFCYGRIFRKHLSGGIYERTTGL